MTTKKDYEISKVTRVIVVDKENDCDCATYTRDAIAKELGLNAHDRTNWQRIFESKKFNDRFIFFSFVDIYLDKIEDDEIWEEL